MAGSEQSAQFIEGWKKLCIEKDFDPKGSAWVLFKHGTIVLTENKLSAEAAIEEAKKIMERDGPVHVGSSHGDFNVSLMLYNSIRFPHHW